MNASKLESKKIHNAIFITGAGQRIGASLAKAFLSQTTFPVVFTYRSSRQGVDELIELGATGIQCDFSDTKGMGELIETLGQKVGSLRAVIHNASLWLNDDEAPVYSDLYTEIFRVHVDAPIYLNEQLLPFLLSSDSELKDIISISDYSVDRANESTIAYLASKAALQNITQNFAKKYAPQIKVNDIAPGLIKFNEADSDDYKKRRLNQSAISIEPGEEVVWQAVQYLMASPYSTGTCLQLNGGRHLI